MPSLLAIATVAELRPDAGTVGVTAIDKRAVGGPVQVGPYGVYADVQADRKHHGGHDKAVYAYAQEDADYWGAETGHELAAGFFGENLRTSGLDVNASRVGDVWRVGAEVELQVTMPREPCATFARWVEASGVAPAQGWVKRFAAARRLGPY
ncbi:MAG: MOSC domain-containing protein, partial [Microbacterium sp.]|nr:MOSC domain-containing protein [Microbacterium sp.]